MKVVVLGAAAALASIASIACGEASRTTDASAGGSSAGGRTAASGGKESSGGESAGGTSNSGGATGGAHVVASGGSMTGGSSGHASGSGGALDGGGTVATGGAPATADAGVGGAAHHATDFAGIVGRYRSWHPQTDEPVDVSSYIFALCRLPTLKEQTFAESEHGKYRRLQDWANDAAVAGIAGDAGSHVFAEGAAIVKEKYVPNNEGALELVARGFMIKRELGFDPARGDWDYAYWEPSLGILHTEEQSQYCGGCHLGAGSTDSVFIDGLRP